MSEMRGAYGGGGDNVGVPRAVGDLDVVEPILLLALLAKDMAARGRQQQRGSRLIPCPHAYRYLDARTNRDMVSSEDDAPISSTAMHGEPFDAKDFLRRHL